MSAVQALGVFAAIAVALLVIRALLDDGGKLHGALKMLGTGPQPDSFDVPPPTATSSAEASPGEDEVPTAGG